MIGYGDKAMEIDEDKVAILEKMVGESCRQLRLSKNLEQNEVGSSGNLSRRTIQKLEAGENCTLNSLIRVLIVCGREDWLMQLNAGLRPSDRDLFGKSDNTLLRRKAFKPRRREGQAKGAVAGATESAE